MTYEATLNAYHKEKFIRSRYGSNFVAKAPPAPSGPASRTASGTSTPKAARAPASVEVPGRVVYSKGQGRDIYGKEKATATKYFECPNCRRKAASFRIASHIERCLSGRNARGKSAGRPMSDSGSPDPTGISPKKRKLESKSQVSKLIADSTFSSLPASRDSTPGIADRSLVGSFVTISF